MSASTCMSVACRYSKQSESVKDVDVSVARHCYHRPQQENEVHLRRTVIISLNFLSLLLTSLLSNLRRDRRRMSLF